MNQNKNDLVMEDFVPYELAVKLKKKGFDYPCLFVYNKEQIINPDVVKEFGELSDDGYYELTKEGGGELDWNFVYINEYQRIFYRDVLIEREMVKAPSIPQVLKWLREEKNLFVCIDVAHITISMKGNMAKYSFYITNLINQDRDSSFEKFDSPEPAAIAAIEYALNYLIEED